MMVLLYLRERVTDLVMVWAMSQRGGQGSEIQPNPRYPIDKTVKRAGLSRVNGSADDFFQFLTDDNGLFGWY
uniref:Uncharacterized protein n=1 Tax=Medicago truncatula TaxID=3880 RepID=A2Q4P5_MEDTR|nr:hypothetical protein MtrDRAFT_AC157507g29v2 [Medicago truncatula]